ncbi:MAG: TRAP transporter large permease subunit [Pseudomonadota bacterium]
MQSFILLVMIVSVFAGIAAGIPVMFVLLGIPILAGLAGTILGVFEPSFFNAIPIRIFGIMENQVLYSVPLFILMGKLLEHSGLAERALSAVTRLFNGGAKSLSIAVIAISVAIACTSGIVGATITMLGAVALPAMRNFQIQEKFSAGLIMASGSLGQILPPSIVLILLSDQISSAHVTNQLAAGNFSPEPVGVGHLFAGALLPGLCLAVFYTLYVILVLDEPKKKLPNRNTKKEQTRNDWFGLSAVLSLFLVPLSILLGFATTIEAAAIGVLVIGLMVFVSGKGNVLREVLLETTKLNGVIFGIIISASVFSLVLRGFEGDIIFQSLFSELPDGALWALISVMLIVFLLGFLIEFVEITYVVVPLTAPVLFALGVDPVWFAILMAVNLQISFLTPPMGISLFYYKSVSGIDTPNLYRSVIPYVAIQLLMLIAILIFPSLATWLPSVLI